MIGQLAAVLTSHWSGQTIIDLEKKKLDLTHQERSLDNELEEEELRYRTMVRYIQRNLEIFYNYLTRKYRVSRG